MNPTELVGAVEAVLFAAGAPLSFEDLRRTFERLSAEREGFDPAAMMAELKSAVEALKERWSQASDERGFVLAEVAGGLAFRSNPRYADAIRAMREERPVRLSRAALETLAIVAYRQPVTKPEIDQVRGVDSSASVHLLLERSLIRITGKKEEPGRPLLYGTTREFLSFFNMGNLAQLPSLREFQELSEDSQSEIEAFDSQTSLEDLSQQAKKLRLDEDPAVAALDEAIAGLQDTEKKAQESLAAEGISIAPGGEEASGAGSEAAPETDGIAKP